jgi:hypothetical protein
MNDAAKVLFLLLLLGVSVGGIVWMRQQASERKSTSASPKVSGDKKKKMASDIREFNKKMFGHALFSTK